MPYDPDRSEKIANLVARWRDGQFSEVVFTASLKAIGERRDSIFSLVRQHQEAFRQSLPYRRGDVS